MLVLLLPGYNYHFPPQTQEVDPGVSETRGGLKSPGVKRLSSVHVPFIDHTGPPISSIFPTHRTPQGSCLWLKSTRSSKQNLESQSRTRNLRAQLPQWDPKGCTLRFLHTGESMTTHPAPHNLTQSDQYSMHKSLR